MKIKKMFKLKKEDLRVINGVSHVHKYLNMLTMPSLCILKVICFIKNIKILWQQILTSITITREEN
jgi:hypothetical protein